MKAMDEQIKRILEWLMAQLQEMKVGQEMLVEEINKGIKTGQEELTNEMKSSQEVMGKDLACVKAVVMEKLPHMKTKICL